MLNLLLFVLTQPLLAAVYFGWKSDPNFITAWDFTHYLDCKLVEELSDAWT